MNDIERTTSLCMQIVGGISCAASILVVVTILSVEVLKKKTYNKYVLYIASANLVGSFGASLGFVKEGTFWCWFQGFVTNYFPLLSLFWTTYLGYMLFQLLHSFTHHNMPRSSSPDTIPMFMQAFIWIFPAFLTLIPLATNTYGIYGDDTDYGWCFMERCSRSTSWSTSFWIIAAFYFWIWAALVVYICFFVYVYFAITREYAGQVRNVMKTAVSNLGYYLLVIVICWGFATMYDTIDSFKPRSRFITNSFSMWASFVMPLFQGTLTAFVFFYTNTEAMAYLKYYLTCCKTELPAKVLKRNNNTSSNSSAARRGISTDGTALSVAQISTSSVSTCAGRIVNDFEASSLHGEFHQGHPSTVSPLMHLDTVKETSERDSGSSGLNRDSSGETESWRRSSGGAGRSATASPSALHHEV
jgi:hypothetical protein